MSIDRALQLKTLHLFGMAAAWSEYPQGTSGKPNTVASKNP
ncbi:hypothetical protein [Methylomonas sp. EFPC1]|nr:hypothetical protein [Methylomonas sp. EFPC1]